MLLEEEKKRWSVFKLSTFPRDTNTTGTTPIVTYFQDQLHSTFRDYAC